MASVVYEIVGDWHYCARNWQKNIWKQNILLFPPAKPLEFVSIDILEPLYKTQQANQHISVISDLYRGQMTKVVIMSKTSSTVDANVFLDHWVSSFEISRTGLVDNAPQFTSKFFKAMCEELRIRAITSNKYHSQNKGQLKQFNRTPGSRLRYYVPRINATAEPFYS